MKPEKPYIPETVQKLIEDSNLHLALCGGQTVGMEPANYIWMLRDKNELINVEQRTKDLQKLAGAMRYLVQCLPYLPDDLKGKVSNFCNIPQP